MWARLVEQRHQERIQEAERYWHTRQFSDAQKSRRPIYVALRARLGNLLIAWGSALLPRQVQTEGQPVIAP